MRTLREQCFIFSDWCHFKSARMPDIWVSEQCTLLRFCAAFLASYRLSLISTTCTLCLCYFIHTPGEVSRDEVSWNRLLVDSFVRLFGPNISKKTVGDKGPAIGNGAWRIEWSRNWNSRRRPDRDLYSVNAFSSSPLTYCIINNWNLLLEFAFHAFTGSQLDFP